MSVKDEYLEFRNQHRLSTRVFEDRVRLQLFLRDRLEAIWREQPHFTHGGLLSNHMTRWAMGFAYYDCRPSLFCRTRCYGLPISGLHDYHMLRLGVLTSESLRIEDPRFLEPLTAAIEGLPCLKIGHWGDAVLEQVPAVVRVAQANPHTTFWWYTRKIDVAMAANERRLPNLRAYLSLDPCVVYPPASDYPYGITYVAGNGQRHERHEEILGDPRLVAVFLLKRGQKIEDPDDMQILHHPRICAEKLLSKLGSKQEGICLSCTGRCRYELCLKA